MPRTRTALPAALVTALAVAALPALPASAADATLTYEEVSTTFITSYFLDGNEVAEDAPSLSIDFGAEIEALDIEELTVGVSIGGSGGFPVADIPFSDPYVINLTSYWGLVDSALGETLSVSISGGGIESSGSFFAQIDYLVTDESTPTVVITESAASVGGDPELDPWAADPTTSGSLSQPSIDVTWGDTITIEGGSAGYFTDGGVVPWVELWLDDPGSPGDWPWGEIFDIEISIDGSSFSFDLPPDFRTLYQRYLDVNDNPELPTFEEFIEGGVSEEFAPYLTILNYDIERPFVQFAVLDLNWPDFTDTTDAVPSFDRSVIASNVSHASDGRQVTVDFDVTIPDYCTNGFLYVELLPPGAEYDEGLGYEVVGLGWLEVDGSGSEQLVFEAPSFGSFQLNFSSISVQEGECASGPDNLAAPDLEYLFTVTAPEPDVNRLAGADRFATSAEVAKEYAPFAEGEGVVYIANGLDYPDALSAAPAAAFRGAPLLLTQRDSLPASVRTQIERLSPELIVIAGGTGVVSAAVEAELNTLAPTVERHAGADRYATSRVLTEEAFGVSGALTVFLATGTGFPDALAASAAAGRFAAPVVLVDGSQSTVPLATRQLLTSLGADQLFIAGGTGVVSEGIRTSLITAGYAVTRLAGADRYATSAAINDFSFATSSTVFLAVGTGYADALAGAALAGNVSAPLFVVPGNCVPQSVLTQIADLGATEVRLLGGVGSLSTQVATLTRC